MAKVQRPDVLVETRTQWRSWLEENAATSDGIWLVRWKAGSGHPSLAYDDVVEQALCFGWVDSQPRRLDDERSRLLLTPRRAGSSWSKVNKERIARLEAAGLLAPAGRDAVERARQDGSWTALDEVETLREPADLRAALDATEGAAAQWAGFPPSTRRAILEWIGAARTEATRSARVRQTAGDAARGVRANQWRQPKSSPG